MSGHDLTRRSFIQRSGSCAAYLSALTLTSAPGGIERLFAQTRFRTRAQEPWGRLEEIGPSVWALISTPLEDPTTLCNGGIIAGERDVLVVESFGSSEGAEWMAQQARALTGRWPTHLLLTHYHGDHTGGVQGFFLDGRAPRVEATAATRDRVLEADSERGSDPSGERAGILADIDLLDPLVSTSLDLGGRTARIAPRDGHTGSDVTVELEDPSAVFCGDLVWNGMFPNYVDAVPSRLAESVRELVAGEHSVYVPGHGPLAGASDLQRYVEVIDRVESAARMAYERGMDPVSAAASFSLPPEQGEWMLFSPRYYEVAFSAWHRELEG